MSTDNQENSVPQSIRHKQILDLAEENPSAPLGEIADQVTSATPELVEQVLEEYGDPASANEPHPEDTESISAATPTSAESETEDTMNNGESETAPDTPTETVDSNEPADTDEQDTTDEDRPKAGTEQDRYPSLEELSEKQQALLEAVAARPAADQTEIATEFDVTRATISRWGNDIPEFEWRERDSFVNTVVDGEFNTDITDESTPDTDTVDASQTTVADGTDDVATTVAQIETDLRELSKRVDDIENSGTGSEESSDSVFNDPELVHKIAHACLESDAIFESEELRILKRLLE